MLAVRSHFMFAMQEAEPRSMSQASATATTESDAELIRQPPESLGLAFRQIGPGLILAGAIVGTGELIATTNLGAKVGFALLWLVVASCFIKVFVQIELGRHAISSGESTFQSFHALGGSGRSLVWWCLVMLLVTQMQIGAMVGGVGQAIHMAAPGVSEGLAKGLGSTSPSAASYLRARPELPWAVLAAVATSALLATGGYRLVEQGTTVLVVMFTVMTVLCVGFLPAEHAIAAGDLTSGLTFRIPAGAYTAAFTMFGITGVGATELLAYPYWCTEKGYARYVGPRDQTEAWADRARGWMGVMLLDAWVSMLVYTVATLSFYLMGAAVLHGQTREQGLPDTVDRMMAVLARMYEPTMGPRLALGFIVLGAFAVLYSTLFAATAGGGRLLADVLRVNRLIDPDREDLRPCWVRFFCVVLPMVGLALFLGVRDPVKMVIVGGMVQALTLPLIGAAAVFLRYRRTDRRLSPGLVWDGFLWLSALGLVVAGACTLWTTCAKVVGVP